jgi:glycosyltransferase involved in cell wall biosynthesis
MKPNYIEGLSIVIPSYNREKQLCRLLDSIFKEDISNLYEIVIIDNNSDYDIYEVTRKYTKPKLRVVHNVFNIHMATNMMTTFLQCKTKWMWIISDDDVVCKDALSIVKKKINKNSGACYLKFSTEGINNLGIEKNKDISNLEDFIDYYHNDKIIKRGNLAFISNGVFNLEILYPYLGFGFEFSYTYIPCLIPVFMSLNSNIPMMFCEEKIIEYKHPGNTTWSFSKVGLGLSSLSHLPLKLSNSYYKKFLNISMLVTYDRMIKYFIINEINDSKKLYNMIYNNIYQYYLTPYQKVKSFIFSILLILPPKLKRIILKLYRKKYFK